MSRSAPAQSRRADAQLNAEKILKAAVSCLSRNPEASVSEIARSAGVGRVTLYGHFPSREALVEAALTRVLARGDEVLERLELTGDPGEALRGLIESSWLLMAQASSVLRAAQAALPPGRVSDLHAKPRQRVNDLVIRGQAEGAFRDDLPAQWLAGVLHHVINGAAADFADGRLGQHEAPRFIAETILAAFKATEH